MVQSGGQKKNSSLRICIKLNAVFEFDAYAMPWIITTIDICKGYWQVPLEEVSHSYISFQTPLGLFQFSVMSFGLHGATATFQRLMVLRRCEDCSTAYLGDIVIHNDTWQDHLHHLECVLSQIQQAGLTLNPAMCQ